MKPRQQPPRRYLPPPLTPPGFIAIAEAVTRSAASWGVEEQDAWIKLRGHLHSGEVKSVGLSEQGHITPLTTEWGDLRNNDAAQSGRLVRQSPMHAWAVWAFVDQQALSTMLAGSGGQQPPMPTRPNKGGRPRNTDADDFMIEAARMAMHGEQGPPDKTQANFVEAMLQWAGARNMAEPYSADTVEKKVKKLWTALWPR